MIKEDDSKTIIVFGGENKHDFNDSMLILKKAEVFEKHKVVFIDNEKNFEDNLKKVPGPTIIMIAPGYLKLKLASGLDNLKFFPSLIRLHNQSPYLISCKNGVELDHSEQAKLREARILSHYYDDHHDAIGFIKKCLRN